MVFEVAALGIFVAASQVLHLDAGQIGGTAITTLFLIALDQVSPGVRSGSAHNAAVIVVVQISSEHCGLMLPAWLCQNWHPHVKPFF